MITDREFALEEIMFNGDELRNCSWDLRDEKEFVMVAVKQYPHALEHATERLRNDKELVLTAVKFLHISNHYPVYCFQVLKKHLC